MILAIPLVFLIGGYLGWRYGQRSGRNELTELRRQNQISRIGTRKQMLAGDHTDTFTSEPENRSLDDNHQHPASQRLSVGDESSHSSPVVSEASDSLYSEKRSIALEQELDELYRISGQLKPVEYELIQRKLEVKALKQALADIRRINEKQLVSVRLQAENQSSIRFKEQLSEKQTQIDSLKKKLTGVNGSESEIQHLKKEVDRVQMLKHERNQLREQSESQLNQISELMEQSNQAESQRKILQKELSDVSRERIDLSGSLDHFNTQIADRDKQLDDLREKHFLIDQKNQELDSANTQQALQLAESSQRLAGTLESLAQSEQRVAELQKEIHSLNQQLNTRLSKLESVQVKLKESDDRCIKLIDRLKVVGAQVQRVDSLAGELKDKDLEIGDLTSQLNEAEVLQERFKQSQQEIAAQATQIKQKETALAAIEQQVGDQIDQICELKKQRSEQHDQIADLQKHLEQIPAQEDSISQSENELKLAQERAKQVDILHGALAEKDKHIASLRKQSDRVMSLESLAKAREAQVHKLKERSIYADQLEKQLRDKDKRIASLQKFENKVSDQEVLINDLKREYDNAVSAKKEIEKSQIQLQKKLYLANEAASESNPSRIELTKTNGVETLSSESTSVPNNEKLAHADLDRVKKMSVELEQSRVEMDNLNRSLAKAEHKAEAAEQHNIELKRLRSELQSQQQIGKDSLIKVQSLERRVQVQEQQLATTKQLESRVRELESVEADIALRDQQISMLENRLNNTQIDSKPKSVKQKKPSKQTKSRLPLTPIYEASAEKDDLKRVNGIGPVMERMLNSLGITSFKQLAEFKSDDISRVTAAIDAFPGRIERDNWVGGAKEQYEKKYNKADA